MTGVQTCALPIYVAASEGKVIVVISSVMGSLTRANGGSTVYRSSKAALNMVARNLAAEFSSRDIVVTAFHPGWVRTDMGGAGAALSPQQSASDLRQVLSGLGPQQKGQYINHDGSAIAW